MPSYKMKNGKGWYCSFYYKDFNGTNRRIKKEGFRTQKEAKNYEQTYKSKTVGSCYMCFGDLYEIYLNDRKARLKPTSVLNIERYWKNYLQDYFQSISCCDIDNNCVRIWQNQILQKNLSPATQLTAHKLLSSIFNFGIKFYGLEKNPAKECGSIGKKIVSTSFWTLEEFKQADNYITENPAKLMLNLLYFSGMRVGEMLALTSHDFDFHKNEISITKNLARMQGKNVILSPKTEKSIRTIPMPIFIMDMVKDYLQSFYDPKDTDLIFPYSKNCLFYAIKKACEQTGIPQIRIHDLRHSHASLLVELGFSPIMIAERLGHEHIETTLNVYSHLYPQKQKELVDQLDAIQIVRF